MRLKIEPRLEIPRWLPVVSIILALILALIIGAIPLAYGGLDPFEAYYQMFRTGFFEPYSFSDTLVKATPLILAGLGVTIAFRMRLWNIGAEGQLSWEPGRLQGLRFSGCRRPRRKWSCWPR